MTAATLRTEFSQNMEKCIEDCIVCYRECLSCIAYCISKGGKHVDARHLTLMMECAETCNTSAKVMQLRGMNSFELCQICARVCDACADSCEEIDAEDMMMLNCSDMCRNCAESCRSMIH